MLFFKYFDTNENQKTILLNEKHIVYCLENEENQNYTDIKMIDGKIFTVPNSITEISLLDIRKKLAEVNSKTY